MSELEKLRAAAREKLNPYRSKIISLLCEAGTPTFANMDKDKIWNCILITAVSIEYWPQWTKNNVEDSDITRERLLRVAKQAAALRKTLQAIFKRRPPVNDFSKAGAELLRSLAGMKDGRLDDHLIEWTEAVKEMRVTIATLEELEHHSEKVAASHPSRPRGSPLGRGPLPAALIEDLGNVYCLTTGGPRLENER